MEELVTVDSQNWKQRSVFVTGHTGFKGGWLCLWLAHLGATVHGFALDPPEGRGFFAATGLASSLATDGRADLGDLPSLRAALQRARPEVVFHLAAQPLVLEGYRDPLRTWSSNLMGTLHLLEAIRDVPGVRAVVVVTTDKVYVNHETFYPYREIDPLGGRDPYSASKAAAEILASSYRSSFFSGGPYLATARAGNVIGGGDWARDRLVPDCLRAFESGQSVQLRCPQAVRPWQHVLEPLSGYLMLAEKLLSAQAEDYACAWNFGPDLGGEWPVGAVAQTVAELWGESARVEFLEENPEAHEAGLLKLDISRVRARLGWRPRWSLLLALKQTVEWHRAFLQGRDMQAHSLEQISRYSNRVDVS